MCELTVGPQVGYRHEALLYGGDDEFVDHLRPFVDDGVAAGEPVLIVLEPAKLRLLSRAIVSSPLVRFVDMHAVGSNPARIIPLWQEFLDEHAGAGASVRGIGEPIWPGGRCPAALVECRRHEQLLNVAFEPAPAFWLVCPYDRSLGIYTLDAAARSHPYLHAGGGSRASVRYHDRDLAHFDDDLPSPAVAPGRFDYDAGSLVRMRRFVADAAVERGLPERRAVDLVTAVNELATNSVTHASGWGSLLLWREGDVVMCEVSDDGVIDDPMIGRRRPPHDAPGGRGMWLVNQLCDLVQLRTSAKGTTTRVHMDVTH